jgi:putative N6-adenine-specific DNA methylase
VKRTPLAPPPLRAVATCGLGLEEILEGELAALGVGETERDKGAVLFSADWAAIYRANWRLRTANRVLVEIASWEGTDGPSLASGARALIGGRLPRASAEIDPRILFHPDRSFSLQATSTASAVRDTRWAALSVKDGLVDGQRDVFGRRASIERENPDLPLRLRLHEDRATLLLDTSGEPLDHRGYRAVSAGAPVREQLAAAVVLASGWDGRGPVVDPMCGTGTLLIEAAWIALGWPPGRLRQSWAFERFPGFDRALWAAVRSEPLPNPGPGIALLGNDRSSEALRAARANLAAAGLGERANLRRGDAAELSPPPEPGLVVVNPPYGERLETDAAEWKALGDLLKKRFQGYRAAVLAGGPGLGKAIGLRPRRRIPVWNGPVEARILLFDLY